MTDNIVSMKDALIAKETDPENRLVMQGGSVWYKYSASYKFDCDKGGGVPEYLLNAPGVVFPTVQKYGIDFWAQNDEEAAQRVEAMAATIKLDGRIAGEIPA